MALRGDERYVTVSGVMERKTGRGVLIKNDLGGGWLARQCLHFSADRLVDELKEGEEGQFKVMEWAAEKVGLI